MSVPLNAHETHVEEIIRDPTITYRNSISIETPLEIWEMGLDNIYLVGRLWGIYGFKPAYHVTRIDSGIHVVDPTGITGDVWPAGRSNRSRLFYGHGRVNHIALPGFFNADGVIIFEWRPTPTMLLIDVKIFLLGNNWISRAVMRLISGPLIRLIEHRFDSNLKDLRTIIRDIVHETAMVRNRLDDALNIEFEKAFPLKK